MKTTRPNFLIVGAPKCGTTALYYCLRKHPEVFLPQSEDANLYWRYKEPQFFCDDLRLAAWNRVSEEEEFFGLFEGVRESLSDKSIDPELERELKEEFREEIIA